MGAKNYGEHHHRAVLSDHEVELIRELYEEEVLGVRVWGYGRLGVKFDVSKATIRDIVKFRRRRGPPANDN